MKNTESKPHDSQRRLDRIVMQHELLFASLLLNRFEPMEPHHVSAIRELLGYKTDDELREFVISGKRA